MHGSSVTAESWNNSESSLVLLTSYWCDNFILNFALSSFSLTGSPTHPNGYTPPHGLEPQGQPFLVDKSSLWREVLRSHHVQGSLSPSPETRTWREEHFNSAVLAPFPASPNSIFYALSLLGWRLTEVLELAAVSLSIWEWFQQTEIWDVTASFQSP